MTLTQDQAVGAYQSANHVAEAYANCHEKLTTRRNIAIGNIAIGLFGNRREPGSLLMIPDRRAIEARVQARLDDELDEREHA